MNFQNLNNDSLLNELKTAVLAEKAATLLVLDYLYEVEARRLFAQRGYPSLFEFCVGELKYSSSAAFRRIASMRTIKALPEARVKLDEGSVNVSTLAQLYSFSNREEKARGKKLTLHERRDLLTKIEHKSQKECEKQFIDLRPELKREDESIRPVGGDRVEIKFYGSQGLVDRLNQLRELLSHKEVSRLEDLVEELASARLKQLLPKVKGTTAVIAESLRGASDAEVAGHISGMDNSGAVAGNSGAMAGTGADYSVADNLMAMAVAVVDNSVAMADRRTVATANDTDNNEITAKSEKGSDDKLLKIRRKLKSTSAAEVSRARYISRALRNRIWMRDQGKCQFVDPHTERKCESRYHLQIDHITPVAKGGLSSESNLRLLCRGHNQLAAIHQFSFPYMEKFLRW